MPRTHAPLAAVDIIGENLVYLQLSSNKGDIFIHQWHIQPADQSCSCKLRCRELMTVMEHRASHYQQLTQPPKTENVTDIAQATYGGNSAYSKEVTLDYQSTISCTQVISAHSSQVKTRQGVFSSLPAPVTVVEPAFQAILRATHFLLSQGQLVMQEAYTEWVIIELNQPLSSCLFCHYGILDKLQFASETELTELIDDSVMTYYFGDKNKFTGLTQKQLDKAIELQLPEPYTEISDAVGHAAAITLFGSALRGFSSWHH